MVRVVGAFCLLTALSDAIPTIRETIFGSQQEVFDIEQQGQAESRKLKGKFLHITDFHPDPFYIPGSNPNGEHPCHQGKGNELSGFYGAAMTECDSPFTLINATFKWIEENVKDKIDFVVWTGDSARHDNDESYPRSNKQVEGLNKYVVDKFVETFGIPNHKKGASSVNDFVVPIVPTIGNNDILPHNIFLPGPNRWTRAYLDLWSKFIPEEQKHSFARGGWFYTEVIPGRLAVISINTLYFFRSNSAVIGCDAKTEPGYEHLEWLRIQLQFMRQRGLKAFLIGHVPPSRTESKQSWDETCYQKYVLWLRQYRDVIVSSFYGHMNIDHFMFHDINDLVYEFDIEGIDDEPNQRSDRNASSAVDTDYHIVAKADYLNELRTDWGNLPTPPEGTSYEILAKSNSLKRTKKKEKSDFLKEIGGPFGERFSLSIVSPSVVPNYFPTLRIIEYNITGLENAHPAIGQPRGHLATENDLLHYERGLNQYTFEGEMVNEQQDIGTDKKKKKKKKPKKSKPKFPVPAPPAKTSPPGPAYSPQTFSLVSWTQMYANLTSIHEQLAVDQSAQGSSASRPGKPNEHKHFAYGIEYTTKNDHLYNMTDLTMMHWLGIAERMGRSVYKMGISPDMIGPHLVPSSSSSPGSLADVDEAEFDDVETDQFDSSKKKKKKKKKNKKHSKLKDNDIWYEFIRRVYVHSKADVELEDDFS